MIIYLICVGMFALGCIIFTMIMVWNLLGMVWKLRTEVEDLTKKLPKQGGFR